MSVVKPMPIMEVAIEQPQPSRTYRIGADRHGRMRIFAAGTADGVEAVEKYKSLMPDLVIMDITMPNKDGLTALKEIKKEYPQAKIVMCSAMGQESYVVDAIKSGAADFIVKPFQADRIISTVTKVLK